MFASQMYERYEVRTDPTAEDGIDAAEEDASQGAAGNEDLGKEDDGLQHLQEIRKGLSRFHGLKSSEENRKKQERELAECRDILRRYLLLDVAPVVKDILASGNPNPDKTSSHQKPRTKFRPLGLWAGSLHLVFADPQAQVRELLLMTELWIVFSGLLGFIAYGFLVLDTETLFYSTFPGHDSDDSSSFNWGKPLITAKNGRMMGKVSAVMCCVSFLASILLCLFFAMMVSHLGIAQAYDSAAMERIRSSTGSATVEAAPSFRTLRIIRCLRTISANFFFCINGINFLGVSLLMYALTLVPASYGIVAAASAVALWFTPDYLIKMYATSTGSLAAIHFPTFFKVAGFYSFAGGQPPNRMPDLLGGELELSARRESTALIEGLMQKRKEFLEKKRESERNPTLGRKSNVVSDSEDLWYVMAPLLEEIRTTTN
ncbi:unnamed protein product [Amoebophrya sp. A25]|nr:unnamed protein product [Amoebophrya sp. A25]|eukprot:GSA25T00003188001.1